MRMNRKEFNLLVKDFDNYLLKESIMNSLKNSLKNVTKEMEERHTEVYSEYHDGVGLSKKKLDEIFKEYCKEVIAKNFPEEKEGSFATLNWLKTKVEKKKEINDKIYVAFIKRIYLDKNGILSKLLDVCETDNNKECIIDAKNVEAWKWHDELKHAKKISSKKWQELLEAKAGIAKKPELRLK